MNEKAWRAPAGYTATSLEESVIIGHALNLLDSCCSKCLPSKMHPRVFPPSKCGRLFWGIVDVQSQCHHYKYGAAFWRRGLSKSSQLSLFTLWNSMDSKAITCEITDDIPTRQMTEPFKPHKKKGWAWKAVLCGQLSLTISSVLLSLVSEWYWMRERPPYQCLLQG